MEVDDVEGSGDQQAAEADHPPEVQIARGPEAVNRRAPGRDGGRQRVLTFEDVGHLVLEGRRIGRSDQVGHQALGPSVPEALDGQQHAVGAR